MKKSLYSLILMDDVVKAVDSLAESQGTNRSNMVNQILAEYVSYTTPEKRINSIFKYIESRLDSNIFSLFFEPHEKTMSLKSSLEYKYRPTIKYEVKLFRTDSNQIGELKVIFRTQSTALLMELTSFFKLWVSLETSYLSHYYPPNSLEYSLEEGKFCRALAIPAGKRYSAENIANAIGGYIKMFDEILKGYLMNKYNSAEEIEARYLSYVSSGIDII